MSISSRATDPRGTQRYRLSAVWVREGGTAIMKNEDRDY